jgi:hypothetical protein
MVISDSFVALIYSPNINHSGPGPPFGIIVFLMLALAIFDLGKPIVEDEVWMGKDIFRHRSLAEPLLGLFRLS